MARKHSSRKRSKRSSRRRMYRGGDGSAEFMLNTVGNSTQQFENVFGAGNTSQSNVVVPLQSSSSIQGSAPVGGQRGGDHPDEHPHGGPQGGGQRGGDAPPPIPPNPMPYDGPGHRGGGRGKKLRGGYDPYAPPFMGSQSGGNDPYVPPWMQGGSQKGGVPGPPLPPQPKGGSQRGGGPPPAPHWGGGRRRKGTRGRKGGFFGMGSVINQAVVPLALLGMQQTYGRKHHTGSNYKGTRRRFR